MNKIFLFLVLLLSAQMTFAQREINISGEIQDTLNNKGVKDAVILAIRVKDSVLHSYTRTDWQGKFNLKIPVDTFQILFTNPKFEDKEFYIFGNETTKDLDFGKIIMPPKGEELNEIVVFSNNEPIFFRGDTLVMVADSFKTAANANVEDLFKKLPGFDVDKSGKIVVHGKEVTKVFVDGDEFFGTDPTIATKNLPANAIKDVEVFEQKIEGDNTDETEKVINLVLKEDSKKGYFGKLNGATDFQKFYEGEFLVNRFKGDQKISIFGLFTNTPRNNFNWQDRYQYGLTEEMGSGRHNNGTFEPQIGNLGTGLPSKSKTGFYFTDKLGEHLKLGTNFTYDKQRVLSLAKTNTEYLLADTTYSSFRNDSTEQGQEAFAFNMKLEWQIDSLTKLKIVPRVKQITNTTSETSTLDFFSQENFNSRKTNNNYEETMQYIETSAMAKLEHNFKKEKRKFELEYSIKNQTNSTQDFLNNSDADLLNSIIRQETHQKKNGKSKSLLQYGKATYVEPLSKKIKLEISYALQYVVGSNRKYAFDKSADAYDIPNDIFSSDFENTTKHHRGGLKFKYASKKQKIVIGADLNNVNLNSKDIFHDTLINQTNVNILPFFKYRYSFSRSKNIRFNYNTSVSNPSIAQLQPVLNNRNLNSVAVGNINLVSQLENKFALNFFTYKATTGSHTYANISYSIYTNAFSNAISYDSIGRAVNQVVNVDGNDRLFAYAGTSLPFMKQKYKFDPFVNYFYSTTHSEINHVENKNISSSYYLQAKISRVFDSATVYISGKYNNSQTESSISKSIRRNNSLTYEAGFDVKLKKKVKLASNIEYIINSQRAAGFDLNYILWNASISKMFLKKENLIISLEANDILDQNISNTRDQTSNTVVDSRTNIIGRYILLRAVYKFNVLSSNKKDDDLLQE